MEDDEVLGFITVGILLGLIISFIAFATLPNEGLELLKKDAIKEGVGEFFINKDKGNKKDFRWIKK